MAESKRRTDQEHYNGSDFGYYRRSSLDDIINSYMMAYVGDGKVIRNAKRYEVAFHAQRMLQELSYDTLHSDKSIELEVGPANQVKLPSDYVNWNSIERTNDDGTQVKFQQAQRVKATDAAIQDEEYDYVYDENGDVVFANASETIKKYQESGSAGRSEFDIDSENSLIVNGDWATYQSKLYGIQPSEQNINPTFVINNNKGIIYFNTAVQTGDIVTLYYISDGLGDGDDLSKCYVPKLAEEALYAGITSRMTAGMRDTVQAHALFAKKAKAAMNNAKIRLMNLRPEELKTVLRNKSKWIKH